MSKEVLLVFMLLAGVSLTSSCASMVTKPIGLATKAVITPVKAVAEVTMNVVGKPIRKTAQILKPVTPVIRVR
jgi:hypothetical protein